MEETKQRKLRSLSPDNLIERLQKLPLNEKLAAFAALKKSIEQDKKDLEEQLKMIAVNGKEG